MSTAVTLNGVVYDVPQNGDAAGWGAETSSYLIAIAASTLQKSGGTFTLTADVNFGGSFGLLSLYYKTRTSNIADAGQFRLARTDVISFRNAANGANLDLGVNASNRLSFDSVLLLRAGQGDIVNADVNASAAIAVSKLAALTASRGVATTSGGVLTAATLPTQQIFTTG